MRIRKNIILLIIFCIIFSGSVFANGFSALGGIYYGIQTTSSLISKINLPEESNDLLYFGGYGYVSFNDYIFGGFGFALLNNSLSISYNDIGGGFGGIISGMRVIDSVLQLNLLLWLGLGGIGILNTSNFIDIKETYFAAYAELTLEAGIKLSPWMGLFVYGGYQIIGNLIPGVAFQEFRNLTPVLGVRLCWGVL